MNLPVFRQEYPHTCLPACIRIVLAYRGREHSEAELATLCRTIPIWGTSPTNAVEGLEKAGYRALWFEHATQERLVELLEHGWPVIVFLRAVDLPHGQAGLHAVVVATVESDHIVCVDPAIGQEINMSLDGFFSAWSALGHQGMVVWLPSDED